MASSLVLKLSNSEQYDFENNSFDILIYENSYEKLIKKIQPDHAMLFDSETFWISLPPAYRCDWVAWFVDVDHQHTTRRGRLPPGNVNL